MRRWMSVVARRIRAARRRESGIFGVVCFSESVVLVEGAGEAACSRSVR